MEDPLFQSSIGEVNLFLRQTFWANFNALLACRAALALSKRGLNILQCFIFLGLGGCGLSFFTELIATSLGEDVHKYFDPYSFFDDEELRKCVELLAGGICFSGQERPQGTTKKLLLHLLKKFMSGEGLRGLFSPLLYKLPELHWISLVSVLPGRTWLYTRSSLNGSDTLCVCMYDVHESH